MAPASISQTHSHCNYVKKAKEKHEWKIQYGRGPSRAGIEATLPLEGSFHFQLQYHKQLSSVMIHILVPHIHYDREEKWLAHFSTFTDPSTLDTQTQWKGVSTSIWPYPGIPLKDKTTTIKLHIPASYSPHSSGYMHTNPILSHSTSVFTEYHFIRSIKLCMICE